MQLHISQTRHLRMECSGRCNGPEWGGLFTILSFVYFNIPQIISKKRVPLEPSQALKTLWKIFIHKHHYLFISHRQQNLIPWYRCRCDRYSRMEEEKAWYTTLLLWFHVLMCGICSAELDNPFPPIFTFSLRARQGSAVIFRPSWVLHNPLAYAQVT